MNQDSSFRKIRPVIGIFFVLTAMTLTGCASFTSNMGGDFNSKGLPNQKYYVGGGLEIKWRSLQAGTAYLVEEKTGKLVMTKSIGVGEEFEFSPGSAEPAEAEKYFGIEMSELKFSLYFIPIEKTVSK